LQYRPESNRWVFGAPVLDADNATLITTSSPQPPAVNSWTHLTGVYDFPERQLRLYVDGQLASYRRNVLLWAAWGGFTVGRGLVNSQPADFFAGVIDEATTDMGAAPDAEIARRASHPAPPAGQFGRFSTAAETITPRAPMLRRHRDINSRHHWVGCYQPVRPARNAVRLPLQRRRVHIARSQLREPGQGR
jgi:hypothetical protein